MARQDAQSEAERLRTFDELSRHRRDLILQTIRSEELRDQLARKILMEDREDLRSLYQECIDRIERGKSEIAKLAGLLNDTHPARWHATKVSPKPLGFDDITPGNLYSDRAVLRNAIVAACRKRNWNPEDVDSKRRKPLRADVKKIMKRDVTEESLRKTLGKVVKEHPRVLPEGSRNVPLSSG